MLTHISWLLKSMKRLPSGVQKYTPFARATGIGIDGALGRVLEDRVLLRQRNDLVASHRALRFRKDPAPARPVNMPASMTTRPRETTVSTAPVTSRPSYGL